MTSDSTRNYQQISRDPSRRYLVIGDLHGRFETMKSLLKTAGYIPEQDVLLSVGDLIDRGPRSVEIIDFFTAPNCYVVRGNHEQMVLDQENWREVWNYPPNGGPATCKSLHAANRDITWLQSQIRDYPICLDVGEEDDPHAFRIVHAEQPFNWSELEFRFFLETSSSVDAGESRLLWGRDDIIAVMEGYIPPRHEQRSDRRSFCGHTPIKTIIHTHDTHWIDTFDAGTLSCVDAITLDEWTVPVQDDEYPA